MKAILAFVFVGAATAKHGGFGNDKCAQPRVTGPCMAYFQRYYYDSADGTCKEFVYGGCRGNSNNFETQQACERECVNQSEGDEKPTVPWWPEKPNKWWPKKDQGAGSGAMDKPEKPSWGKPSWGGKWSWSKRGGDEKERGEGGEVGSGEMVDRPAISYAAEEYLKRLRAGGEDDRPAISYAAEEFVKRLGIELPEGEGWPMGSGEFEGEEDFEQFQEWIEQILAGANGDANGSGELDTEAWWTEMAADWGAKMEEAKEKFEDRIEATKERVDEVMEEVFAGRDGEGRGSGALDVQGWIKKQLSDRYGAGYGAMGKPSWGKPGNWGGKPEKPSWGGRWSDQQKPEQGEKPSWSWGWGDKQKKPERGEGDKQPVDEVEAESDDDAAAGQLDAEPETDDLAEAEADQGEAEQQAPKNKKEARKQRKGDKSKDAEAEADEADEADEVDEEAELRKQSKKAKASKKAKKAKN